jgi:hypothetical protein
VKIVRLCLNESSVQSRGRKLWPLWVRMTQSIILHQNNSSRNKYNWPFWIAVTLQSRVTQAQGGGYGRLQGQQRGYRGRRRQRRCVNVMAMGCKEGRPTLVEFTDKRGGFFQRYRSREKGMDGYRGKGGDTDGGRGSGDVRDVAGVMEVKGNPCSSSLMWLVVCGG